VPRVLVIDDNPQIRDLVETVLEDRGHCVDQAPDGDHGLRALYESNPDLIVLDINMPDRDGWETLERIRELSDVPVLVLTGESGEEPAVRALRGGADDIVTKSFDTDEFTERVEQLLDQPGRGRRRFHAPRHIGPYVLGAPIASGGMGVVYHATDTSRNRPAAVKVLPYDLAEDPTTRERFERECRTALAVSHPNIVPIYAAGEAAGVLYLAMRLIEGPPLLRLIRSTPGGLEPAFVSGVVTQVAAALAAAHAAGVVHRDVKPGNVLLEGSHAYLTDFGLSKLAGASASLTQPGRAVGTAHYLAPEQVRGDKVDERTDVYALGCLAYEALAGEPPFTGDNDISILFAQLNTAALPLSERRPGLAPAVDDAIACALAKDPHDRFPTAPDFAGALAQALGAS
jgi:serine/threonine protein kinase/CheY-like chemotaxis protein